MLSSALQKTRTLFPRLHRTMDWLGDSFPLSLQGLAVLFLLVIALRIWGYGRMDLVVFALTVCALAIILCNLALVVIAGLLVRRKMHRDSYDSNGRIRAEAGFPNDSPFRMPSIKWLPLVSLQWQIVYPDFIRTRCRLSADGRYLEEEITPLRRCRSDLICRRFTVNDVLGLCRFSWRQTRPDRLLALPRKGNIRQLPVLRSLSAEDGLPNPSGMPEGDRMEIRAYTPGDPVRNIMWGVYARNRELNVRLAEKSVFNSRKTLAYLISGPDDEAAAAVARVAVESGALGDDWTFSADGAAHGTNRADEALELIAGSRGLKTPHAWGLDTFLEGSDNNATHCIVFAAADSSWTQELRRSAGRFQGQLSVILATDGFKDSTPRPLWRRILFRDNSGAGDNRNGDKNVSQLGALLNELRQYSGSAMIVDRRTGLSFDQALKRV